MTTKTCGFCGGPGVTKKHVWPDWLRNLVLKSRGGGKGKKLGEIKVGMPCEACSDGWMSALENEVKPFLAGMVFPGEQTMLGSSHQLALVRWAMKTAMVYEYTATEDKYFSSEERRAFKERFELPENVWIWAARYDGTKPIHTLQHRVRGRKPLVQAAHCLTFSAGFLVFQVFAYRTAGEPIGQYAAITPTKALVKLWPSAKVDVLEWPPKRTINDEELKTLDERFRLIVQQPAS